MEVSHQLCIDANLKIRWYSYLDLDSPFFENQASLVLLINLFLHYLLFLHLVFYMCLHFKQNILLAKACCPSNNKFRLPCAFRSFICEIRDHGNSFHTFIFLFYYENQLLPSMFFNLFETTPQVHISVLE